MQDMFEPSFPPAELKKVPVLDLNGTKDEVLPPATVDANRKVMEPYTKKYRVGRIEGLHHYLFTQDSIKTVVTTWMRYIDFRLLRLRPKSTEFTRVRQAGSLPLGIARRHSS